MKRLVPALVASVLIPLSASAQEPGRTLITNARIFDGRSAALVEGQDVLVEDGLISAIGANVDAPGGTTVIDASQIKMHLAGGVGTEFDPIDGRQFTRDEIEAAVEVAEGFGTYVAAHVYTPDGVRQAIEAGVRSIEHGNLITPEIAQLMADNDVYLSPQVVVYLIFSPDLGPMRLAKGRMVMEGLDRMFELAKEYGVTIVFGTEVVVNADACADQNREFVERARWFPPAEVLQQATANSGELLQLSGERSPYPGGVGVIEEGAHADHLLIDGNPLEDITILTTPEESLALIMKGGTIYKNEIR